MYKNNKHAEKWFYSKGRARGAVKKPQGFEDWFYTGPTAHFGHYPPKKGGKKK